MRLIDTEVLANWIDGSQRLDTEHDYEEVARYIEECPTVDAVPVVRCRDCRHRDPEDHKCECGEMERQGCPFPVDDDYFCKYGARREWGDDDE